MKFSQFAAVSLVVVSGFLLSNASAENSYGDIDKVLGSASVESGQHYNDISVVNGSVKMASDSSANEISVVNGSIKMGENVSVHSASTVNGSIEADGGLKTAANLETVNGKIRPGGNAVIGGNVDTVNGDITLDSSEVAQDVSTVSGDISLNGTTVIKGDLVYKPRGKRKTFFGWGNDSKPTLHIGADAVVEGRIILQQQVTLQLDNPAMQDKVEYQINDGR